VSVVETPEGEAAMVFFEILFKFIGGAILVVLVLGSPFLCYGAPLFTLAALLAHWQEGKEKNELVAWIATGLALMIYPSIAIGYIFLVIGLSDLVVVPGLIFYGAIALYVLYLTFDFGIRLAHYYRLPDLNEKHRRAGGGIDIDAARRDAPDLDIVQNQPAWVSRNQALRAAQALQGLTGKEKTSFRPEFRPVPMTKVDAATEVVRAYTSYLWGATGAYIKSREKELVELAQKPQ